MAFDQKTRNLLQRTVSACRRILDQEFTAQLQELYGIQPDGTLVPLATLDHLADEELEVARLLRERINHLEGSSASDALTRTAAKPQHVARVIREQAFTVLNRLAALRLCEERGLVLECVRQGVNSEGFQLFKTSAGSALGATHDVYREYLHCVFDELAVDLGVLFDRFSPLALLFPRQDALAEVLTELNGSGQAAEREVISAEQFGEIWQADETIGWIYQYYNDEKERKKMREESAAPRNSRELAVRNQFFTPRYVVEFLTDNTLGRIWYEMTQGDTSFKGQCRYLVRRPTEIFLKPGDAAPEQPEQDNLSQEDLLKQPVYIPHRPLKDPRTILMLDPACGSMHFGLYAFDLFEVIYDEAWALEEKLGVDAQSRPPGMKSLHATYGGKDAFLKDVPRLIIEHNLHGIDIDPRCAQIAGLSLWLRAHKAWQRLGLKPAERPAIKRSNIVCAEPMPGEKELLREFVERKFSIDERSVFLVLLETIFEKMTLAGEAGSLLKIEEEIGEAIAEAKHRWRARPVAKQQNLFPEASQTGQTEILLDFSGMSDEQFWVRTEERLYASLREYAEQTEDVLGFQRRLFAEDAARGFAFIDVCRKRYDVALMNPPFGEAAPVSDSYLRANYPLGYIDLYTAFLDRGSNISAKGGLVGAITSRTAFTLSSFANWRRSRLLGETRVGVCVDLGFGVLDSAMVEVAAYTLEENKSGGDMLFIDLDRVLEKDAELLTASSGRSERLFAVAPSELLSLPNATMAYFLEPSLRADFSTLPAISSFAEVLGGNATSDDERFIRCFWEVSPASLTQNANQAWRWISKGGEYSLFYLSIHLVVDWREDGGYLGEFMYRERPRNGYLWGPKSWSSAYMGSPGVVWSLRTQKGVSFRALPAGCAMSGKSAIVTTHEKTLDLALLGILNSERIARLARCLATFGSYEKGAIASLPVERKNTAGIASQSEAGFRAALCANSYSESDPHFFTAFRHSCVTLRMFLDSVRSDIDVQASVVLNALDHVNREYRDGASATQKWRVECISDLAKAVTVSDLVSEFMGFAVGRWDIRYAMGEQAAPELPDPFAPLPFCPPGQLQNTQGLPARPEEVPAAYPVRIPWDGILVDDPNHPLDIERRVREVIETIWNGKEGGPTAETIEHEAGEILGVKSLRDYFRKPAGFFADHLKRYSKSRRQAPIYWPLSTASGSYTLWIYYHRLTPDTLYKCVQQFVNPKLADVEKELTHLRAVLAANEGGTRERKRVEELETLRRELIDLRTELELWAPKWNPNLNDGVLITAAPLWKLFRLPKWQKDLKACWKELEKGDYDWAHLAYSLWPDRVSEKCRSDRSMAIAHGLEDLCQVKAPIKKLKKAKGAKAVRMPEFEIDG